MKGAILNDECMHCNDRECHDGEHFCNQAIKKNSFYKNAKLYKGLEVIHRPTYEELERENAELKERFKHRNCLDCSNHHINIKLFKAKEIIKEFVDWASWQGNSECPSFKSIQDKAEQFLSEVENV